MKYIWICKGCFLAAGVKPDDVEESCIGGLQKFSCAACGTTQDRSWLKHVHLTSLPQELQDKVRENVAG